MSDRLCATQGAGELIKGIDPEPPVLIALDSNSGQRLVDQMAAWAGTATYSRWIPTPAIRARHVCL